MMRTQSVLVGVLLIMMLQGCHSHGRHKTVTPTPSVAALDESIPRTDREFRNHPDHFQFAIVSDRSGDCRPGVFATAVAKLNLLQPEFVISVGDFIAGYTADKANLARQWEEFERLVAGLEMPFFYVPGNHDITNSAMVEEWERRFGRAYYHFVYRDVLFLCLNTEDPPIGHISDAQVAYVANALAQNPGVRWTFVFMHEPMWTYEQEDSGWNKIEALLRQRPHTVFAGHHHTYVKYQRNGRDYIKLATTGGRSDLRGPDFGQFDHITWVTMGADGPRIANLLLDGILDKDVVTAELVALSETLLTGDWLRADPITSDDVMFTSGKVTLHFRNPNALPLKIHGAFSEHAQLRPTPSEFDLVVAPQSEQTLPIDLEAAAPTRLDQIAPLLLKLRAAYEPPDRSPLTIDHVRQIFADWPRHCPRRTAPITIDGRLDEWPADRLACRQPEYIQWSQESWRGPEDGWFRFATAYDDEYLYVALESFDDCVVLDPARSPYQQDGFYVFLDARPDPERSLNRGLWADWYDKFLVLVLAPGQTPDRPNLLDADRWPIEVKIVCVQTETGLAAEIAIPVTYLNERQGAPWQAVRLNVAACDDDGEEGRSLLWWHPRWNTSDNYTGSGTFLRR